MTRVKGLSLLVHTLVAISSHDYAAAEETGRRALEVFRAQNHRWGVTTSLLVLARIANNRRSGTLQQLLQESAPLVTSGNDLWGRAHILTLQGYEAFRALDLDLAKELHSTAHGLAVELGDRAAQAENLLALGHVHLCVRRTTMRHASLRRPERWSSSSTTLTISATSTKASPCWPFPRATSRPAERSWTMSPGAS